MISRRGMGKYYPGFVLRICFSELHDVKTWLINKIRRYFNNGDTFDISHPIFTDVSIFVANHKLPIVIFQQHVITTFYFWVLLSL